MNDRTDTRLTNRILAGLAVGVLAGAATLAAGNLSPTLLDFARAFSVAVLDPFGQVFLRMLFFVVVPLVFCSLASGVAQLGDIARLGPLAGRTFTLFALNMSIAVALGLVMMTLLQPGGQLDAGTRERLTAEFGGAARKHIETHANAPALSASTIVDMLMPRNLFGAFVGNDRAMLGEMLPLIVFAILVGAAATRLGESRRRGVQEALETVTVLMTAIVNMALKIAPFAVPAMIYSVIVKIGFDIVIALGLFVAGCAAVLLLQLFGTLSIWLRVWTRFRPLDFFLRIRAVLITAFSTSSSSATLPTALAVARDRLGISSSTAGFVLPLGATMNMSGTALYEGCVVLFVAQVFGVHLGLTEQVTLLVLAVLSAVAVAGVPGGSLPLIAGLLAAFGIPPEGIGIVLGVDRLLDMLRTTVNVGADIVTCAVVDAQVHGREAAGQSDSTHV